MQRSYFIYLLRCADNSLYTGITTDVARRFEEHSGKPVGAKYTAARTPIRMERVWSCEGRSAASKLEARIKQLTHAQKEQLVSDASQLTPLLGHVVDPTLYREESL